MRWLIATAALSCQAAPEGPAASCPAEAAAIAWNRYHGDALRLGWNATEAELRPADVAARGLDVRWESPALDTETIDGVRYPPHIYAAPLWIDDFARADAVGHTVFTATSNGWAYAIAADARACAAADAPPGSVAWATRLVDAAPVTRLDGGMPLGVLSTPILDLDAGRLYVTAMDRRRGWLAFALDANDGEIVDGWPVVIDADAVEAVNRNGPASFGAAEVVSQRGALARSPVGDALYVAFGTYRGEGVGWLVAIDTRTAAITSAFSSAPWTEPSSNGGIWGAAGPTIDERGDLWVTTGNSPADSADAAATWGNSLLQLDGELRLRATYTPFNYCALDRANMDLAASPPVLLPALTGSATPNTVAFGGKQGNVYLVDRDAMTAAGTSRPPCSDDAQGDRSLLPPGPQPQFGTRGPLNVFGPYSDIYGELDHAKMRSRLGYAELDGGKWLFAAGASKAAVQSETSVPPSLAKLAVIAPADAPAYLEVAGYETETAFVNPGSVVVSSDGGAAGIVWVLDENAPRIASLLDPATPGPILYAFDASTLELLWRSPDAALARGGKYGTAVVAHGTVVVGTDRITAFGMR